MVVTLEVDPVGQSRGAHQTYDFETTERFAYGNVLDRTEAPICLSFRYGDTCE